MQTKDEFRSFFKECRKHFVEKRKSNAFELSLELFEALRAAIAGRRSVAGYVSFGGEPDVFPLLARLGAETLTSLPYMGPGETGMAFRYWSCGEALERSPFGFRQPSAAAPAAVPDAIFIPVIGFDRALNRLGHGKGHYDRALAQLPHALKIGVAWSVQEQAALPTDRWDIPLDAVLTEQEWICAS